MCLVLCLIYPVSLILWERSMLPFCHRSVWRTQRTGALWPESYFTNPPTVLFWGTPLAQLQVCIFSCISVLLEKHWIVTQYCTEKLLRCTREELLLDKSYENYEMDYTSEELAKQSGMLTLVTSARTCSLMKGCNVDFSMFFCGVFVLSVLLPSMLLLSFCRSTCALTCFSASNVAS